jgi:Protein of unknown function (DUF1570)
LTKLIDCVTSPVSNRSSEEIEEKVLLHLLLTISAILQAPPEPAWKFDEVQLRNGALLRGVLLQEATEEIAFQVVYRQPGRPTMTLRTKITRREIANITRLKPEERAALSEKLSELDPTGDGERRRMEALELTRTALLGRENEAWQYRSERFHLVSGATEDVTRRVAVRLEQLHAAFGRYFPARISEPKPITVLLAARVVDPAIYDPQQHRIVCGSDLLKLSEDLQTTRMKHKLERDKLEKYEADLRVLYKSSKPELDRHLAVVVKERDRLRSVDRANDAAFGRATERLFALIYHETFHATMAEHADPNKPELPRWLNEGIAQVYETALLEAGELRIGHADTTRLSAVQKLLQIPGGFNVTELLRGSPEEFLAGHAGQRNSASQKYLMAWAVTHYLMFARGLIGGPEFEAYLAGQADPVAAFVKWTVQEIEAFEKHLREYLERLKPDGSLIPKKN